MFNYIDLIGLMAAIFSLTAIIPQIIKSWRTKLTRDISVLALSISVSSNLLWLIYGYLQADKALIFCNMVAFLLNSFLFYLKISHYLRERFPKKTSQQRAAFY